MEIAAAEPLTGDASLAKFPVRRDSVRGQGGRGAPLAGAKLKRGSRSTAGRRGSAGAAVEGALFRAGWLLGLRQPLAWGVGAGRCGLERLKEGEPGIAEGRRGIRIPATSPVISGPLRSREGRGEEGADARGRLASGGARVARLPARWGQGVGGAGGMRASGRWAGRVGAGNWPWAELGRSAALGKGGTGRRRERRRPGPRWAGLGKRFGLGWVLGFVGFSSLFNSKLFYS